jgi:glycosyltransferase involved in cell wall biosynthesis
MGDFTLLDHPDVTAIRDDVRIVRVEMDWFCRLIKKLDVEYRLSWLFVYGLRRWHWLAYRKARSLHAGDRVAVAHQLGPVGFRNPGYLYRLGVPSYWGPIGGLQYIDLALAFRSNFRYGALSLVRNVSTFLAARSRPVRAAMKGFDRVSFATLTNERNFARLGYRRGPVLSDQATIDKAGQGSSQKSMRGTLHVVWCGSIDGRKNIGMLLDIATCLWAARADCHITIIGSGRLLPNARALTEQRGLDNVTFTGQIARDVVQHHFRKAHALIFTSLSEANTATFFEALEAGCIPLALDLDGFSSNITDEIGFKVDASRGWDDIVGQFTRYIAALSDDAALRERLAEAGRRNLPHYTWSALAARHAAIIETLMPTDRCP